MKRILLFWALLFAFSITANAQSYDWVGTNFNGWSDPNSWEDEFGQPGVPGYGADIYIGSNSSVFFYPQYSNLYSSINVIDNATLASSIPITVFDYFYVGSNASVELYIDDKDFDYDGIINVQNGIYDIHGQIKPFFGGINYMPQIGDEIIVATANDSGSICNVTGEFKLFTFFDNGFSQFEVIYVVVCDTPNQMTLNVSDINYTGAKSWDGEAGNGLWVSPANWDPNGVPTPDEYVIINKIGGSTVTTGDISQDRISIGNNNSLTANGNIKISHSFKLNETSSLNWTAGALQKRISSDNNIQLRNWGTLNVNGISIEDSCTLLNYGVIQMNGNININNGKIYNNSSRAKIFINYDNLTIGYTSGSEHLLYNGFGSTIEKTVNSGSGTSSISLTDFVNGYGGILRSEQGTLAIGDAFVNSGIVSGSGSFSFPAGFINTGVISPGSSPGILTVIGDFTSSSAATFNIEIDGSIAGTEYDQIIVTNEAILEGTIDVTLGYLPADDAIFEIVTAANLVSCDFPAQITTNFEGTDYTFDVVCQNNSLYLMGVNAVLSAPSFIADEIDIYPNPIKNEFNIKLKTPSQGQWILYNQLGQSIMNGELQGLETKINTQTLESGFYALQIKDENNRTVSVKKIIKN